MSYNGSGTFVINTAGQPVVSGTVISSTAFNALTADLATGLSTAITKDGQTTPTANIPMGNNKITGLAVGTAATDAANLSQVQSTTAKLVNSISGADTITGTMSPNLGAYATGQMFYFVAVGANTGAVTINIDSLGAKSITRDGTTALAAGDIQSGEVCVIVYDGTQFQLVNGASQSASIVTENLTVNKATVLNESGGDNDTRIEGDTDANLFFADASTDRIGIGTSSPSTKLHVVGGAATEIRVVTSGDLTTTGASFLRFGGSNSGTSGYLGYGGTGNTYDIYNGLNGPLEFYTNASKKMVLDASGNLGLGVTPSAWSGSGFFKAFQIAELGASLSANTQTYSGGSNVFLGNNGYHRDSDLTWRYTISQPAAQYRIGSTGVHSWHYAASGTAGNAISFTQAMTLDASGNLGVGTTNPGNRLSVMAASTAGSVTALSIENPSTNAASEVRQEFRAGGTTWAYLTSSYNSNAPYLAFGVNSAERARITSGGDFLVGTTNAAPGQGNVAGVAIRPTNGAEFSQTSTWGLLVNRKTDDGSLVLFYQDGASEGSISVSGNTVSYNAFAGSHWSQLQDGSKPDILRGTVMESINELCEWPDETNERLPKSKISDTAGSKKVYGVFMAWDNDWTETNDMYVTAVGAFICRVNGSVTVQEGDLLESNGDGTARVQADDIIRSSTIGKVTSTVKTHQYDDGSYCVPTVLYCG